MTGIPQSRHTHNVGLDVEAILYSRQVASKQCHTSGPTINEAYRVHVYTHMHNVIIHVCVCILYMYTCVLYYVPWLKDKSLSSADLVWWFQ